MSNYFNKTKCSKGKEFKEGQLASFSVPKIDRSQHICKEYQVKLWMKQGGDKIKFYKCENNNIAQKQKCKQQKILSDKDIETLESGWLTDEHKLKASNVLKKDYSSVHGLQDTLLQQNFSWDITPKSSEQGSSHPT